MRYVIQFIIVWTGVTVLFSYSWRLALGVGLLFIGYDLYHRCEYATEAKS